MPNPPTPHVNRRTLGALVLILLTVTAVSAAADTSFEVTTVSPAANAALTEPVQWKTTVSGLYPDRVEYYVDDELRWTERYEPWVFNGDEGRLDPALLAPGPHTLKTVAYHHGEIATDELTVTVPGPQSAPPAATPPSDTAAPSNGAGSGTGSGAGSGTTPGGTPESGTGSQGAPADTSSSTPSPGDLAVGKPVSASSVETSSLAAANAADGNASTRWSSAYADGQWWQVDLGSLTMVESVSVDWEYAYASSYAIQVSTDGASFTSVVRETAGAAGVKRTTFAPVATRFVRVLGLTRGTPYGFSAFAVEVYGPAATPQPLPLPTPTPTPKPTPPPTPPSGNSGTNLALGKAATASSVETGDLLPQYAVDGRRSTRWGSAYESRQWWQVDLGSRVVVNKVSIDWEYARPSDYRIQVSNDGSSFQDVARASTDAAGVQDTYFAAVAARYVRVQGWRRATEFGISAWEIEVFGPSAPAPSPTPPPPPPTSTPPSSTAAPSVSGTVAVDATLGATPGTWTNAPTSFAYAWLRCGSTGLSCVALNGATTQAYKVVAADVGATLRARVTATNAAGSTTATSSQTIVVPTPVPVPAPSTSLGARLPGRLGSSGGGQYYVDATHGNDGNPGTVDAPWRTIARAWSAVPAGSVINVRAGTYTQQTYLTGRSDGASNPVTLRPYPGETVTLQNGSGAGAAVYIEGVNGLRIQGFRVTNPSSDGIKVTNSSNVEIVGNDVYGCGNQGILVVGSGSSGQTYSSNVQLWSNRVHGNGQGGSGAFHHGIYYGASSDYQDGSTRRGTVGGVIANNVVYDQPTGYLVQLGPQADGVIVTNNTLTGATSGDPNTGSGIRLWGTGGSYTTRNVVVVNNAIAFNRSMGVHADGLPGLDVHHNLAYANPGGDFLASGSFSTLAQLNTTALDPRWDSGFRPQSSSPLLGRADPAYAPQTDASGAARRAAPTIGAYEG